MTQPSDLARRMFLTLTTLLAPPAPPAPPRHRARAARRSASTGKAHTALHPPSGGFTANSGVLNQITDELTWQNPETLEVEP